MRLSQPVAHRYRRGAAPHLSTRARQVRERRVSVRVTARARARPRPPRLQRGQLESRPPRQFSSRYTCDAIRARDVTGVHYRATAGRGA